MAAPIRLAVVTYRTGRRVPIATIEEALAHQLTPEARAIADEFVTGAAIDDPAAVGDRLVALARDTGFDELVLSSSSPRWPRASTPPRADRRGDGLISAKIRTGNL